MGNKAGLAQSMPVLVRISRVYLRWHRNNPSKEHAPSIPRKYFNAPKSLSLKQSYR